VTNADVDELNFRSYFTWDVLYHFEAIYQGTVLL